MDGVRLHAQVKSLDRALICEMVKKIIVKASQAVFGHK